MAAPNINRARLLNELPRDPLQMLDVVQSVTRDAFVCLQQDASKRESELQQTLQAREALISHLEAKVTHLQKETTTATNSLNHMTAVNSRILDENNSLKQELEATKAELLRLDQFRTILSQSMNQSGFTNVSSNSHALPSSSSSSTSFVSAAQQDEDIKAMNRSFQADADKADDIVSEIDKTLSHNSTTFNVFSQQDTSYSQSFGAGQQQRRHNVSSSSSSGAVDEARALFRSAKARLNVNDFQTFLALINRVHGSEAQDDASAHSILREASVLFANEPDMLHRFTAILDNFRNSTS